MNLIIMTIVTAISLLPITAQAYGSGHDASLSIETKRRVTPQEGEIWMAIVGDSSVNGAAAHESYQASLVNLAGHALSFLMESRPTELTPTYTRYLDPEFFNIQPDVPRVTRVVYSKAEFAEAKLEGTVSQKNLEAKASLKLDTEEYSFGYMIGSKLNIKSERMVFVGQNGKKVETISEQFDRIHEVGSKTLPPLILMSYVANNICHPDVYKIPPERFHQEFKEILRGEINQAITHSAHPTGTTVVVLAPLDVSRILTDEKLLTQTIPYQGRQITCKSLWNGSAVTTDADKTLKDSLVGMCRGILGSDESMSDRAAKVRHLQSLQIEAWKSVLNEANAKAQGIQFVFAESVRDIEFEPGDLANDCFHPSIQGHEKIAKQLLSNELQSVAND